MKYREKFLVILGFAGLVVSIYLTMKTADPSSVACSIGGGCETVLASKYARIGGIPVAIMGVVWYLVFLGLIWQVYFQRQSRRLVLLTWIAGGLAFSLYLLALEAFVIKYYCTWCLVSLAIVILITLLVIPKERTS